MKHAAIALREFLDTTVGPEGAFLGFGTVTLAIGAGYVDPAGPWWVIGGMSILVGILLARRPARGG